MENNDPTPTVPDTSKTDIIVLRAELEAIKAGEKRIYEVLRLALQVILAMSLILAGYGWYHNSIVSERERAALLKDLHNEVENLSRITRDELAKESLLSQARLETTTSNWLAQGIAKMENIITVEHQYSMSNNTAALVMLHNIKTNATHAHQRIDTVFYLTQGNVLSMLGLTSLQNRHVDSAFDTMATAGRFYVMGEQEGPLNAVVSSLAAMSEIMTVEQFKSTEIKLHLSESTPPKTNSARGIQFEKELDGLLRKAKLRLKLD